MKKEPKSGILSADKSADCRPTVGGVNVIAVLVSNIVKTLTSEIAQAEKWTENNAMKMPDCKIL